MPVLGFAGELSTLKNLYMVTAKGYDLLHAEIKKVPKDKLTDLIFNTKFDKKMNVPNFFEARAFLQRDAANYLREVIFVRLISAVEVMLIDHVSNLFNSNRQYLGKKIDIETDLLATYQSLDELWGKIIKEELRNLNGRAFNDVITYYRKKFDLDFSNFRELKLIEEMYERRHILVHALGHTDEKYRKKYSTENTFISIDEAYLVKVFSIIEDFYEVIRRSVLQKIYTDRTIEIMRTYTIKFKIRILDGACSQFFHSDFQIQGTSESQKLKAITKSKIETKTDVDLVLSGDKSIIGKYVEILKRQENRKGLQITKRETISRGHRSTFNDDELLQLHLRLGPHPWEVGLKDTVALELNVSKTKISHAMNLILDNEKELKRRAAERN